MNAFILAGGQSTRMNRDKALLELHGRPLIRYAVEKLRVLGLSPSIIGSRPDLASFAPVVPDLYPNSGPLGGIATALKGTNSEENLFLAVDLPFLPSEFLRWLIERAAKTCALATIPRFHGNPQPLCAIYRRALLPYAEAALVAGNNKVMHAVQHAAIASSQVIDSFDVESIHASGAWPQPIPLRRWFHNLNTPADIERAALEQSPHIH